MCLKLLGPVTPVLDALVTPRGYTDTAVHEAIARYCNLQTILLQRLVRGKVDARSTTTESDSI